MNWIDLIALALLTIGALFVLLAALGVVRLPDVYCRLSATTKAAPFGASVLLAGAALAIRQPSFALQAAVVAIFLTLTAPVAAHALARAAYHAGVPASAATQRPARAREARPDGSED